MITSQNIDIMDAYHRWYYDSGVWQHVSFLGVPCLKSVSDLWNYQEIIHCLKPSLVVEFGTHHGGSALYLSFILKYVSNHSRVVSVDLDMRRVDTLVKRDPRIVLIESDTASPMVARRLSDLRLAYPGSILVVLDSDHHKTHVLNEMMVLRDVMKEGDYMVIEDGNVNGNPVLPGWGDGPMEAIAEYERLFPSGYIHDRSREGKFGFTFAPNGYLVRTSDNNK